MPNIRTFETPALDIRPTEVGVEATAAAARRGGTFFNQAAAAMTSIGQRAGSAIQEAGNAAVKYLQHREISAGAAHFAQMQDSYISAWNDTLKNPNFDPNDPTVAANFRAGMQPNIDQWKDSFITEGGRHWAETHANSFREHMFAKTSADMSRAAGAAFVTNHEKEVSAASNAVFKDPTSLDLMINQLRSSREGKLATSPNLSGDVAVRLRSDLENKDTAAVVDSTIRGAIRSGIEEGTWRKIAEKYPQYVDADAVAKYEREERAFRRREFLEKKQAEDYERAQKVRNGRDALSKLQSDSLTWDENGKPIVKPNIFQDAHDIGEANGTHEVIDHARQLQDYAARAQREKREAVVTNEAVRTELYNGLFDPDHPTTEVDIYKNARELSDRDIRDLVNLRKALEEAPLKGPRYTETMHAARSMLGVDLVIDGHQRYANFINEFIPQYLRLTPEQRVGALDTRDPNSLISKVIKSYEPTEQDRINGWFRKKTQGFPFDFTGTTGAPGAFVPPSNWEWNEAKRQYRDPATGYLYDFRGTRVKS